MLSNNDRTAKLVRWPRFGAFGSAIWLPERLRKVCFNSALMVCGICPWSWWRMSACVERRERREDEGIKGGDTSHIFVLVRLPAILTASGTDWCRSSRRWRASELQERRYPPAFRSKWCSWIPAAVGKRPWHRQASTVKSWTLDCLRFCGTIQLKILLTWVV